MTLLLDTHVLLWALLEPARLSPAAAAGLADPANEVLVSAVVAWEIAIKQSLGKLTLPGAAESWLPAACVSTGFDWLAITHADTLRVRALPWHHRDPFDRLLISQAVAGRTLVTHDSELHAYGIPILQA